MRREDGAHVLDEGLVVEAGGVHDAARAVPEEQVGVRQEARLDVRVVRRKEHPLERQRLAGRRHLAAVRHVLEARAAARRAVVRVQPHGEAVVQARVRERVEGGRGHEELHAVAGLVAPARPVRAHKLVEEGARVRDAEEVRHEPGQVRLPVERLVVAVDEPHRRGLAAVPQARVVEARRLPARVQDAVDRDQAGLQLHVGADGAVAELRHDAGHRWRVRVRPQARDAEELVRRAREVRAEQLEHQRVEAVQHVVVAYHPVEHGDPVRERRLLVGDHRLHALAAAARLVRLHVPVAFAVEHDVVEVGLGATQRRSVSDEREQRLAQARVVAVVVHFLVFGSVRT